jgi:outer membrane protein assembly factor BamE (lipoprotein component of BamABCDE complex)
MPKLYAALVLSAIVAFPIRAGSQVRQGSTLQIENGKTTYDQVVSAIGAPSSVSEKDDGTRVIAYVTRLSTIHRAEDAPSYGWIFAFDPNGILTQFATLASQACAADGGLVGIRDQNCWNHQSLAR